MAPILHPRRHPPTPPPPWYAESQRGSAWIPRDRVMTASRAKLAWQKQRHAELRNTFCTHLLARSTYATSDRLFWVGR